VSREADAAIQKRVAAYNARLEQVHKDDCPTCDLDSDKADSCEFRGGPQCPLRGEIVKRTAWDYVLDALEHQYGIAPGAATRALETSPAIDWKLEHLYSAWDLERLAEKGMEAFHLVTPPIERFEKLGIPVRLVALALDARSTEPVKLALRLCNREGVLLALSGIPGVGKSVAAAVALLAAGRGRWVRASDLARVPKDGEDGPVRDSGTSGIVVIDDVGTEHSPSGYAAARICDLVELREAAMQRTIITTNLDAKGFKERYGERIASRINGDALGWHHVSGPDYRAARHLGIVRG
jgi:hypothetical protein